MSRFKRALIGFMVIANLGIYSAFALWVIVDGGLPTLPPVPGVSAQEAGTEAPTQPPPATATPLSTLAPAGSPTPGWTPPAITLAPLPTVRPKTEMTLAAAPSPAEAPPEVVPTAEAPTLTEVLPDSARVTGVVGHRQALPLSCESRSAADLAAFFGVIIDELEFAEALPRSDDPDKGFVGDIHGKWGNVPPNAYGVHAPPVARLLRERGLPAEAQRYMTWEALRAELAAGRPVMVWVTGHVEAGEGLVYTASDGRRTIVAPYEHTVIVVGYDEDTVLVVDGANTYRRSVERFMASWGALRNMAVTVAP